VCLHAIFGEFIFLVVTLILFFVDASLVFNERVGGALSSLPLGAL